MATDYEHPFQDPDLDPEQRIDDLLGLMTRDEKVACLSTNPSVPRLGVRCSGHVEGLHGLALGGPGRWGRDAPIPTTTFPQAIGLGETWDPDLVRRVAEVESDEARWVFHTTDFERGGIVVRAPNADLGRDPRWGRTEECYGEDPYFNGTMTVAFVRGLQGDDPRYLRCASLMKHFLANSNENEREWSSSSFDGRLFHEYYSVPFRMGVEEGGSRAYMAAYNAYNGTPCTIHPMLIDVTVKQWGQDGIICTDGGAFKFLVNQHRHFPDLRRAAKACLDAGINQFLDRFQEATIAALEEGLLTEADLERALRGVFRVMLRLGLLDPPERVPYTRVDPNDVPWEREERKQFVRHVTCKSIVLLKNARARLPLDLRRLKFVAVLGSRANQVLLDWYSGTPPYVVTPLEGIRKRLEPDVTVAHAEDEAGALELARAADVVIVCAGNHPTGDAPWAKVTLPSFGKEAVDRRSLTLEEERFILEVFAANPNTVVVLVSSFPYAINWTDDNVDAIVHVTHNSQELGNALADVLFGDFNPAGRLVQTWPRSLEQLPPMFDYDIRHGRGYMYSEGQPLYPFGYGLSYTTFAYAALRTSAETLSSGERLSLQVEVTNTGSRAGEEVVQLYVRYENSGVKRPNLQLCDFRRVAFEPGEKKTVELELRAEQAAYYDVAKQAFVLENGTLELMVGRSSADHELRTRVTVVA